LKESIEENCDYYSGKASISYVINLEDGLCVEPDNLVLMKDGVTVVLGIKSGLANEVVELWVEEASESPIIEDSANGEDYPGMVPPQYDEDYTGDDIFGNEEETTEPETEAEIDPEVTFGSASDNQEPEETFGSASGN
jgi:hypothetical protein